MKIALKCNNITLIFFDIQHLCGVLSDTVEFNSNNVVTFTPLAILAISEPIAKFCSRMPTVYA